MLSHQLLLLFQPRSLQSAVFHQCCVPCKDCVDTDATHTLNLLFYAASIIAKQLWLSAVCHKMSATGYVISVSQSQATLV